VVTPRADVWADQDPEPLQDIDAERVEFLRTGYRFPFLSSDTKAARETFWGKLGRHVGWRLQVRRGFEPMTGWFLAAGRECRSLSPGDADIVVVSGPPFGSFSLARRLAAQIHCPFVLDYRDLWTVQIFDVGNKTLNAKRNLALEGRFLAESAAVTAVSTQSAAILKRKCDPAKVQVVTNGYDMDRLSRVVPHDFSEKAIVYAGMLYPPLRTLDPILQAMSILTQNGGLSFRLHYFGPHGRAVETAAGQMRVRAWVVNHGLVSRETALTAVAGAHAVVVVNSIQEKADGAVRGVVPGKVYEALGLGKRILLVAPEGSDVADVVGRNGRRFSGNQVSQIANYLIESTASEQPTALDPPKQCCWENLALTYDELLSEATKKGPVEVPIGLL
jgi:glycosyltransferase involved in cell wall biosynthesis